MTRRTPSDIAYQLGSGLLSFPVTHFAEDFSFDEKAYRINLDWLNQYGASGLFAAGGTGEFFSLTLAEVEKVVDQMLSTTKTRWNAWRTSTPT